VARQRLWWPICTRSMNARMDLSITRAGYPGPADYASDSAELGKGSGRGRIAAFLMTASGRGATFCI
jgi:hypothetical protein